MISVMFFPSLSLASPTSEKILLGLSDIEKISQLFLVNIEGDTSFHPVEFLEDGKPVLPGGILFFSYNIASSSEGVKSFVNSINAFYSKNGSPLPYIAVDQEGGDVCRLRGITSHLPSEKEVSKKLSASEAFFLYEKQAKELRSLGITLNLAPVAEVETEANKDFLETRTFGSIPDAVSYSLACILAYEEAGVGTVAKHFPGNANSDPHKGLSEINLSTSDVFRDFILPFALILSAHPSCVLVSHAVIPSFDEKKACMSSFWIEEVLKKYLGYKGLIMSDDIFMGALSDELPERAAFEALTSGVDIIMLSEKKFLPIAKALLKIAEKDSDFASRLFEAEVKVIDFKIQKGLFVEEK